jgi:hypothetical protein
MCYYKKGCPRQNKKIYTSSFLVVFGSGIRDPGSAMEKNRIRDKQHWFWGSLVTKNIRESDTSFSTSPSIRDYNFINCLISICNKVVFERKDLIFLNDSELQLPTADTDSTVEASKRIHSQECLR